MDRIEFRKGEPRCRFDGILMTNENCNKLWGYNGDDINQYDEKMIEVDGILYTDASLMDILEKLGAINDETGITLYNVPIVKEITTIKPFNQLMIDYPKLSLKKYNDFFNEIENYTFKNLNKY